MWIWSERHILHLLEGGLQFSGYQSSKSYHLMVSVGLEDVGGHLSVVTDVMLDLLKLKGQRCCLGECNGFQLHQ